MEKPAWLDEPEMTIYRAARTMAALGILEREHQRRAVAAHFQVRVRIIDGLVREAVQAREIHRDYPRSHRYWTRNWPDRDHPEHPNHERVSTNVTYLHGLRPIEPRPIEPRPIEPRPVEVTQAAKDRAAALRARFGSEALRAKFGRQSDDADPA